MTIKKALLVICGVIVLGFLLVYISGYDESGTKSIKEYKREKPLFKPIEEIPKSKPEPPKAKYPSDEQIKAFAEQKIKKWNAESQNMGGFIREIEWAGVAMQVKCQGYNYQQCKVIALDIYYDYKSKFNDYKYIHMMLPDDRGRWREMLVYRGR